MDTTSEYLKRTVPRISLGMSTSCKAGSVGGTAASVEPERELRPSRDDPSVLSPPLALFLHV